MDQSDDNKRDNGILSAPSTRPLEADNDTALATKEGDGTSVNPVPISVAAMSKVKSEAERQLEADEILALKPEIVDTLSSFVGDMNAYKRIFPEAVGNRLEELENLSETIQAMKKTGKKSTQGEDIEEWTCSVYRDDMRHWPQKTLQRSMKPPAIIEAFYDHFEEAAMSATNAARASHESGDAIQRVVIKSDILRNELENITSVKLRDPVIVPPPFKLLVHFYPQIDAQLANLENELAEADLVAQNRPDNPHADGNNEEGLSCTKEEPFDEEKADADIAEPVEKTQEQTRRQKLRTQFQIRIDHLKCLRDFIQSDLKHLVELRTKFENKTLKTISFQNLWYLFKPGDVVVSTRNHSTVLYKVYSVTGGQKRTQTLSYEERFSRTSEVVREPYPRNDFLDEDLDEDNDFIEDLLRDQLWGVGTWVSFKLDCFSLESNGKYVGPMNIAKKIKHYVGEVRVLDLDVYPVQFHQDHATLLQQSEERGRKYLKSAGHKSYDGYTVPRGTRDPREELQGDVFIDLETYLGTFTRRIQRLGKLEMSRRDSSVNGEARESSDDEWGLTFTNHEIDVRLMEVFLSSNRHMITLMTPQQALSSVECLQLMPNIVPGYAFGLRKWCGLAIDLLSDIDKGREAQDSSFDDLVIPDSFRDMLTGLVENHTSRSQRLQAREAGVETGHDHRSIDIVRGKGQGLIILLHGPPGSGKTSTAETIAAFTHRPLYSITCGDLGLQPKEVETALQGHTAKASKWGCVLLLDEADVFLMQRDWQNVQRNALVSVLLRQLEYYSGILFLTTNRPGVIDEAFLSRIHLSLRYPLIDLVATKRMWSNIMNRIERDNKTSQIKVVFHRERLLAFAEQQYIRREKTGTTWNGRQIRNAFQTAIAMGTSQRVRMLDKKGITPEQAMTSGKRRLLEVKLTRTSLLNISQSARAFEDYMQHLRGNDSDLARQAEVRDDYFDSAAPRATKDYGERQSLPKRPDSLGMVKGTSAAKTSTSAGKARQGYSRKARNMSEDDDDGDDDLNERSDDSSTSDDDDSDGH